jgi:hypothetical protein
MDLSKIKLSEEEFAELEESGISGQEFSYIKKVGSEWCVFGESGRKMGCYSSKKAAEKRLAQVEMFKHMKANKELGSVWECYCIDEGIYFFSSRRCDLQRCPESGDDAIEVTGEI